MKHSLFWWTACAAAAAVFAGLTGCETRSADERPLITPSAVTIHVGESVEFVASEGYEYAWALKNENWGTLSTRRGSRVVYTSLYQPPTNATDITQILTVQSVIGGGGGTNLTGEAYITHL